MTIQRKRVGARMQLLIDGQWLFISDICRKHGLNEATIRNRLRRDGMTEEKLLAPVSEKMARQGISQTRREIRVINPLLTSLFKDYARAVPVAVEVPVRVSDYEDWGGAA